MNIMRSTRFFTNPKPLMQQARFRGHRPCLFIRQPLNFSELHEVRAVSLAPCSCPDFVAPATSLQM